MMNKPTANYHTHTYLCKHAEGKPIDYVKKAIELGYEEIAITDHAPLIDEIYEKLITRRMTFDQYYNNYLPDLEQAKNYSNQINVLKGLEIEYFDLMKNEYPKLLNDLDILIIGQHYFYAFDQYISVYSHLTDDEIKEYASTIIRAMETGFFKIVAHPEIFAYRRKWDKICDEVSRKIIEAAKQNNVYLEFNVNGIRNCKTRKKFWLTDDGKTNYSYPRREFFELVKEYNLPVIINDDAHDPNHLFDEATREAYEIVNDLGLEIINKIK